MFFTIYSYRVISMGTAATNAKAKYNQKTYDMISIRLKKGVKEKLEFCAKASGKSVNQYVVDAVFENIKLNRASQAVQVRTNIRFREEISYVTLKNIFKDVSLYDKEQHMKYFLAFFEECYPSLIKKFMAEQNISRDEILSVFYLLPPESGAVKMFREKMDSGQF